MWRSKKRLLLVALCVALVGGIAATGIGAAQGWFGAGTDSTAAATPPGPDSPTPGATPAPPASPTPTPSPSQFTPPAFTPPPTPSYTPPTPTVVRGNDDGSFGGPAPPPIRVALDDQPTPAGPELNPAPAGGGFNTPASSYGAVDGAPGPSPAPAPVGLAPATGDARFQQPPGNTGSLSDQPAPTTRRAFSDAPPAGRYHSPASPAGPPSSGLRIYDDAPDGTPAPAPLDRDLGAPSPLPSSPLGNSGRHDYGRLDSGAGLASSGLGGGGGVGEPGPKQLEGLRAPSLTVEKIVPDEIQVGKQTTFTIKVRNVGQTDAEQVVVFDQTPKGTRYVTSSPEAARAPDGSLMWQLGTLKAGEEGTVAMQLIPLEEGRIGSVARVAFQAQAAASTICTKPLLTVEHTGPSSVLIGETVNLQILISNPGTGVATGVILEEDVPDGLSHASGKELEYEVGELRPGESRKLELQLTAEKPGLISNLLLVRGDGNLIVEDRLELEVVAPRLDVAMTGPSKRYLERQATYNVAVQNPGTAPAENIELVAYLPKGLKFISTNNQGQYDAANHAVYWSLEELPPRMSGEVQVTALPIETGQQKLRVEGRGDLGLSATYEQDVVVEGLAELFFQVTDQADPIEVGSKTVYEVRIVNQGSKTDTNVRVEVQFPAGLRPVGGDGPTRVRVSANAVVCEPLARLAPKETAVYKFTATGYQPGDQRIRVTIGSDEMGTPVAKEESTRVYTDQ